MNPTNRLQNIFDSDWFVHNDIIDPTHPYTKQLGLDAKEEMKQRQWDFNAAYHIIIMRELTRVWTATQLAHHKYDFPF